MATLTFALSTSPVSWPAGTALGKFSVQLQQPGYPTKEQQFDLPLPPQVVFNGVNPGPWTFGAAQLNAGGAMISQPYMITGEVPLPAPVPGQVVVSAAFTVS